jgi:transposase-like protein
MARARRSRAWWSKTVERHKRSGLTARAYAAREGLSASTLSWWSSQLGRGTRAERGSAKPVALEVQLGGVRGEQGAGLIEVELEGAVVRLPAGTEPQYIAALVRSLGRAS